jgi:hypothetical protein
MTARVFIHPRCTEGVALCALEATLEERSISLDDLKIFVRRFKRCSRESFHELVRCIDDKTYEMMNGERFQWASTQTTSPAPEAA